MSDEKLDYDECSVRKFSTKCESVQVKYITEMRKQDFARKIALRKTGQFINFFSIRLRNSITKQQEFSINNIAINFANMT